MHDRMAYSVNPWPGPTVKNAGSRTSRCLFQTCNIHTMARLTIEFFRCLRCVFRVRTVPLAGCHWGPEQCSQRTELVFSFNTNTKAVCRCSAACCIELFTRREYSRTLLFRIGNGSETLLPCKRVGSRIILSQNCYICIIYRQLE